MNVWLVGSGSEHITSIAHFFSEDEADEMVDRLITEDYEFKGEVSPDPGFKVYEWRHPNGDVVRQMAVGS